MFQTVAMYGSEEVGYGESEILEDSQREAAESVPALYPVDDVELQSRKGGQIVSRGRLDAFLAVVA